MCMYMCTHMCVCVYMCEHVCMCVYLSVCFACLSVCAYMSVYVYVVVVCKWYIAYNCIVFPIPVPAIAQTRSSHSAVRGRNGILNCQAAGDPEPTINWLRNNLALVNNTKYTILENGSLWIGDIEDSDGGNYSCQATNIAGTDIATTNLIIYSELYYVELNVAACHWSVSNHSWQKHTKVIATFQNILSLYSYNEMK